MKKVEINQWYEKIEEANSQKAKEYVNYVNNLINKWEFGDPYKISMGIWDVRERLQKSVGRIAAKLNYELNNKKILDLGCGAIGGNVESSEYKDKYEPWLLRFLYDTKDKTNLEIFGVDCGDLSNEKFPHLNLNLLEEKALEDNFKRESFDLVHASHLVNSPELERQVSGIYSKDNASLKSYKKLMGILEPQVKKILKPNGIFLIIT